MAYLKFVYTSGEIPLVFPMPMAEADANTLCGWAFEQGRAWAEEHAALTRFRTVVENCLDNLIEQGNGAGARELYEVTTMLFWARDGGPFPVDKIPDMACFLGFASDR